MADLTKKKGPAHDLLSIDYGVCAHIGQRRHHQDNVLVVSRPDRLQDRPSIYAVADGMGGQPGGAIASRMACNGLNDCFEQSIKIINSQKPIEIIRRMVETILRVDRHVRLRGLRDGRLADMGTTLSCLMIAGGQGVIAHVGDSRIYRLRKGRLSCLTVDHTFVQDMIFEGQVDPARAHLHPLRHMLTNAVGTGEPLEFVDARIDMLKANDCFLLCTDGLYNAVDDISIHELLDGQALAADTAKELVAKARQNRARDNITAVVVKTIPVQTRNQNPDSDLCHDAQGNIE